MHPPPCERESAALTEGQERQGETDRQAGGNVVSQAEERSKRALVSGRLAKSEGKARVRRADTPSSSTREVEAKKGDAGEGEKYCGVVWCVGHAATTLTEGQVGLHSHLLPPPQSTMTPVLHARLPRHRPCRAP